MIGIERTATVVQEDTRAYRRRFLVARRVAYLNGRRGTYFETPEREPLFMFEWRPVRCGDGRWRAWAFQNKAIAIGR